MIFSKDYSYKLFEMDNIGNFRAAFLASGPGIVAGRITFDNAHGGPSNQGTRNAEIEA